MYVVLVRIFSLFFSFSLWVVRTFILIKLLQSVEQPISYKLSPCRSFFLLFWVYEPVEGINVLADLIPTKHCTHWNKIKSSVRDFSFFFFSLVHLRIYLDIGPNETNRTWVKIYSFLCLFHSPIFFLSFSFFSFHFYHPLYFISRFTHDNLHCNHFYMYTCKCNCNLYYSQ